MKFLCFNLKGCSEIGENIQQTDDRQKQTSFVGSWYSWASCFAEDQMKAADLFCFSHSK
jgi:hypothetical protein